MELIGAWELHFLDRMISFIFFMMVLMTGCATQYVPELASLPEAEKTIDAVVEFHPLRASPGLLSGHDTFGVLADDTSTARPTKLTDQISMLVFNGLLESGLFQRLTLLDPHLILFLPGGSNDSTNTTDPNSGPMHHMLASRLPSYA